MSRSTFPCPTRTRSSCRSSRTWTTTRISLNRPAPLTISVSDREEINTWNQRLTLQVNHAEDFEEVVGIAPVFAFEGNQRIDGVISRELFPVGDYAIRIFVAPGNGAVDRRYEITVDTLVTHAVAADSYEPNDWPLEAPLIGLPFVDSMSIENPWAVTTSRSASVNARRSACD